MGKTFNCVGTIPLSCQLCAQTTEILWIDKNQSKTKKHWYEEVLMDLPSCLMGDSLDHSVRLEKSVSSGYSFFFLSNLLVKCQGEWQNVFTHPISLCIFLSPLCAHSSNR